MRKVFLMTVAALMAVAFVACNEKKSNEEENAEEAIEEVATEARSAIEELTEEAKAELAKLGEGFFGTYTATLPGNPGLVSALTINADGSYHFAQTTVEGEEALQEDGTIKDINSDLVLTLTSYDGATTHLFKVVDGKLLMLNADGTEPEGATRKDYFFTLQ